MSYKIAFNVNKGNVKGYSITDLGGAHETKSELIGNYDSKNKILSFKEQGIIYTKSPITQDDFCFINFKSETFTLTKSKTLKGDFKGLFSDNTECINGKIEMVLAEKIAKRTEKISKKIMRAKRIDDSIKNRINPIKLLDTLNMNILRKDQILSVFTKSKKVDLVIYDGGKEDGDIIRIVINDKVVLDKFEIKNKEKVIPIFINEDKIRVKIVALTNGTISPNTMSVKIRDEEREIDVLSNLKKGESAQIDILKKIF
ncbi:MAG: hypothetical protein L3J25_08525 [Flavobacteriaceae bacterium]|nr:hypothetical protein [Flavobacteriaceae bacterium]